MDASADHHWSDCATHNAPAYPAGPCNCGRDAEVDAAVHAAWPEVTANGVRYIDENYGGLVHWLGLRRPESLFRQRVSRAWREQHTSDADRQLA